MIAEQVIAAPETKKALKEILKKFSANKTEQRTSRSLSR